MNIEDLKKSKEMMVWQEGRVKKYKAIIIHISADNKAWDSEGLFWDHYEEIKEPKYRPYNADDDLVDLLDCKVRIKNDEHFIACKILAVDEYKVMIGRLDVTLEKLFQDWENLDGTPLGVKL